MITLNEARTLYRRYEEGSLSHNDLRQLATFILSPACPAEWQSRRGLFAALLEALPPARVPEGFEERLRQRMQMVVQTTAQPAPAPDQPLRRRTNRLLRWATGLAAAAVLGGALWLGLRTEPSTSASDHALAQSEERSVPRNGETSGLSVTTGDVPAAVGNQATPTDDADRSAAASTPVRTASSRSRRHCSSKGPRSLARTSHRTAAEAGGSASLLQSTAQTPEEAAHQLQLIADALSEVSAATRLKHPVVLAMDWTSWRFARVGEELTDNH